MLALIMLSFWCYFFFFTDVGRYYLAWLAAFFVAMLLLKQIDPVLPLVGSLAVTAWIIYDLTKSK